MLKKLLLLPDTLKVSIEPDSHLYPRPPSPENLDLHKNLHRGFTQKEHMYSLIMERAAQNLHSSLNFSVKCSLLNTSGIHKERNTSRFELVCLEITTSDPSASHAFIFLMGT